MQLNRIKGLLHGITPSEVNQILKLFGHWPIPSLEFEIPKNCLAAIWLADFVASMGILDQAMRSLMLEELHDRIVKWTDGPPEPGVLDDCCVRIADRRFLFTDSTGFHVDLATGQKKAGLPEVRPVEKMILDVFALYRRRQQQVVNHDINQPA